MMKKVTITLTAVALLAAAFMFTSCAGNKRIVTARGELVKIANKDYSDHFWGVANAVSSSEDMAAREATLMARGELANQVQVLVTDAAKKDAMNSHDQNTISGMVETVTSYSKEFVSNTTAKETITEPTKDGKYSVYVLVTVSKDEVVKKIEAKMGAEGKMLEAAQTKAIMNIIESATKDIPTE